MARNEPHIVLVRCVCGKKYRISNAAAGTHTTCPECGSLIEVTAADLVTGFSADGLIRIQEEQVEARDALPVSPEPVTLAGHGATVGVTERVAYSSEEALLATALGGRTISGAPAGAGPALPGALGVRRSFVEDLLASFYFAGNRNNALNVLLTAFPFAALTIIMATLPFLFKALAVPFLFIVVAYIIQFYWQVLRVTSRGEDEIPWFDSDWDMYDDVLWPIAWIIAISTFCSAPAILFRVYSPMNTQVDSVLYWVLLTAGWFFWPIAVMSVSVGNTILFLRPDWLIRSVIGVGPVYVVAWLLTLVTLVAWYLFGYFTRLAPLLRSAPVILQFVGLSLLVAVSSAANLYFGYVLFRNLGLLFRHFRTRLPWKF